MGRLRRRSGLYTLKSAPKGAFFALIVDSEQQIVVDSAQYGVIYTFSQYNCVLSGSDGALGWIRATKAVVFACFSRFLSTCHTRRYAWTGAGPGQARNTPEMGDITALLYGYLGKYGANSCT